VIEELSPVVVPLKKFTKINKLKIQSNINFISKYKSPTKKEKQKLLEHQEKIKAEKKPPLFEEEKESSDM